MIPSVGVGEVEAGAERCRKGSREEFFLAGLTERRVPGRGTTVLAVWREEPSVAGGHEDPTRFLNQRHPG